MASATSTKKKWGYSVTGGTDATTITSGDTQLVAAICTGTASADIVTISDVSGTQIAKVAFDPTLISSIPLHGMRAEGVSVTLSATGSVCNLIVL